MYIPVSLRRALEEMQRSESSGGRKVVQTATPAPVGRRDRPKCGARTRIGGECQRTVVEGKRRCVNHGGASTGPTSPEGRHAVAESNRRRASARRESMNHMSPAV